MEILKSFGNKKIGYLQFDGTIPSDSLTLPCHRSKDCCIILFVQSGNTITSDFADYKAEKDSLFF
jgi:AraC family transcriptional activator of pobA